MSSLNPNNPFVHDEYYFLGKPGSYLYEESQIYTIRLIHHIILIVIGLPLCCFVFYLILCKSPARFLPYKKMFLLTAAVDVFILMQFLLVQARLKPSPDGIMITFVGLVARLGYPAYCPMMVLNNWSPLLGISMLAVQCYYRYYAVKRNQPPSVSQLFLCFFFALCLSFISAQCNVEAFCFGNELNPLGKDDGPMWYPEVPIPPLLVSHIAERSLVRILGSMAFILSYVVAILFSILTMMELKKSFSGLGVNKHVQLIQKQLTRALLAQFFIPFLTTVLPRVVPTAFAYLARPSELTLDIASLASPWFSILNLLSTVVFIHPYRSFALQLLPWTKGSKWQGVTKVFAVSHETGPRS